MPAYKLSKTSILLLTFALAILLGSGTWAWQRFGPSTDAEYQMEKQGLSLIKNGQTSTSACALSIKEYKQVGREMQFLLYAKASGLSPYTVEITQKGRIHKYSHVPHRPGTWFSVKDLPLAQGPAKIRIVSENESDCEASGGFDFSTNIANEVLPAARWIRHGSDDIMLDVRPIRVNGKLYLKDFADYQDGRNRVYLIDNIVVEGLDQGLEVQPGYLYSIITCWIDAPYSEWWNKLRNRSIRQQNVWLKADGPVAPAASTLRAIPIPEWFGISRDFNAQFDTTFPEFGPIAGKMTMTSRFNEGVSPDNYYKRGVSHLSRFVEPQGSVDKMHHTETMNFFEDRGQDWFASLSRAEVEKYADSVYPTKVYGFDFEIWNNDYPPAVRQRLIWFAERIKKRHPEMQLFDYWGGSAVSNDYFMRGGKLDPAAFKIDYQKPETSFNNFRLSAEGKRLSDYFSIDPINVYPRSFIVQSADGLTHNNYLLLSAVHTARINRLFSYQKTNKSVWFAWTRYQPQHDDPIPLWNVKTTDPRGELDFSELATMPASQALGMSLFSIVESDGYLLWHDDGPRGRNVNDIAPDPARPGSYQWYPADGKSGVEKFNQAPTLPGPPRYSYYASDYYALGTWMAKQMEDILTGGKKMDLDYRIGTSWRKAGTDQAAVSAAQKEPFVLSVVKDGEIAVLAIDCFQQPNSLRKLTIRLPNGKEEAIQLYGNWPSLYRGEL